MGSINGLTKGQWFIRATGIVSIGDQKKPGPGPDVRRQRRLAIGDAQNDRSIDFAMVHIS